MIPRPELAREVEAVAAADPAARAIEFRECWHTWGEVSAAMACVDEVVDAHGGPAPVAVGVLVRTTAVHVAVLLGSLRRGDTFVVINPSRGRESVRADVAELGLRVVLGSSADLEPLVGACPGTALIALDALDAEPRVVQAPAEPGQGPHHPGVAVRMLTSGTTGPPKRIDLGFDALAGGVRGGESPGSRRADVPARERAVAIVNSPLAHLGGIYRILQCILGRRPFVLIERFEVEPWLRAVRTYRPKAASLVPTALRMVLEADPDPADLSSLKVVTSGTAPLSPDDADAFTERFGVPVLTSYAATEFAGGVAGWTLADHQRYWQDKRGSAGRAQPGCRLRVVDEESGVELGPDQPGLLEVKPAQLGADVDWIRTTDLARIDADGFLFILGRADHAIIRGGFKVLPDRVRDALEQLPAVRSAVVLGVPDARLGAVPVALVELRDGARADGASLRADVSRSLAGYEVPAEIHVTAELPRTVSGKVDLRAAEQLRRELVGA